MRSSASGSKGRGRWIVPVFLFLLGVFALARTGLELEDWASSPEAYFLTNAERTEWKALDSRDSRQGFIERYWLKRDPSPGTERNEFRDTVLARIKTADDRFRIASTPGSRTARGLVFIVLGNPARAQNQVAPRPPPDAGPRVPGIGVTPVAVFEGSDTTTTWLYELDRTPKILEVVHRPTLQIKIVVEPSRRSDSIQDPGLFNQLKELVARATIVNPDLVPQAGSSSDPAASSPLLPRQTLSASVRQLLEAAPAAARGDGVFVGSVVVFAEKGEAETVFWVFTPSASRHAQFHALIRSAEGVEVASFTEPAQISSGFSTLSKGAVALRRLSLPAGSYRASVALTGEAGNRLASAEVPVQVPALDKGLAVSSLLITRGPAPASTSGDSVLTFAGLTLPPRADAAFASSESLWYFVEIANPSDPTKVFLEPRLRRGAEPAAGLPPFPAKLQPLGPGRYLAGIELPLASLGPADYTLYLTVSDGAGEGNPRALRRADFQITR